MSFGDIADSKRNDVDGNRLKQIRQSEKESHIKSYIKLPVIGDVLK